MIEGLADGDVHLEAGNAVAILAGMPDAMVDAVVTDPPYGLEFMGKDWDRFTRPAGDVRQPGDPNYQRPDNPYGRADIRHGTAASYGITNPGALFGAWCSSWAGELLRVTKPGGHALIFGGSRTWHRLAVALEDAGWEIRDTITWLYGSGFPKSLDVSKAIDARLGAERPVVGQLDVNTAMRGGQYAAGAPAARDLVDITTPGSEPAAAWSGWGTALKPGFEPIIVARRPLTGTVADNVLAHGTGALNIGGCRTPMDEADRAEAEAKNRHADFGSGARDNQVYGADHRARADGGNWTGAAGRWPTNVLLGHSPDCNGRCVPGCPAGEPTARFFPRFRYGPKAGDAERPNVDGIEHPTVKPLDLMRWLVRLATPEGALVLDPFAGSGTTGHAAVLEGRRAHLIERHPDYLPLIRSRLAGPLAAALF